MNTVAYTRALEILSEDICRGRCDQHPSIIDIHVYRSIGLVGVPGPTRKGRAIGCIEKSLVIGGRPTGNRCWAIAKVRGARFEANVDCMETPVFERSGGCYAKAVHLVVAKESTYVRP